MEKLKRHSLYFSLILYFSIGLIVGEIFYIGISKFIDIAMINTLSPKPDNIIFRENILVALNERTTNNSMPSITSPVLFNTLKIIRPTVPFIIFGITIIVVSIIFYHRKLKFPFALLQYGIDKVEKQDLDFDLKCNCKDELGLLLNTFDSMKNELKNAFQELWDAKEKQNLLFRAFAHDIRTPLTVLKGNNDVIKCLLDSEGEKENITQSLCISAEAIQRIEIYTDALKDFKNSEKWKSDVKSVSLGEFATNIKLQCQIFKEKYNKKFEIECNSVNSCLFDKILIQMVLDKMIENALRFAHEKIKIEIELQKKTLTFRIKDDGKGFSKEALQKATDIFYSTDKARGHSGMGLAIAKQLLDTCNSNIVIANLDNSGACVAFSINV